MKKKYIGAAALIAAMLPLTTYAHQHAVYEIGGEKYEFVVGSLGEPITVDDMTGVDLRVSMPEHAAMGDTDHHAEGGAVTGLENALQVELIAGDTKKIFELSPKYNTPGAYTAKFYPTVATTLSYRFLGTIRDTPVDLVFTCRAEGAENAEEGEKEISPGVKQISKTGGFGCPSEKEELGFPEESIPVVDVANDARSARTFSFVALSLAALALLVGFVRRRN